MDWQNIRPSPSWPAVTRSSTSSALICRSFSRWERAWNRAWLLSEAW